MTKQLRIWTIQLARWRLAKEREIFLLDITAKSGITAFAPDFGDVMRYKRKEMSQEEYTKIYLERMEASKQKYPVRWSSLMNHPEMAFACYCKDGVFCHRHLFLNVVEEHVKPLGFEVLRMGELK